MLLNIVTGDRIKMDDMGGTFDMHAGDTRKPTAF